MNTWYILAQITEIYIPTAVFSGMLTWNIITRRQEKKSWNSPLNSGNSTRNSGGPPSDPG
jgi:hypothetical protein